MQQRSSRFGKLSPTQQESESRPTALSPQNSGAHRGQEQGAYLIGDAGLGQTVRVALDHDTRLKGANRLGVRVSQISQYIRVTDVKVFELTLCALYAPG